MPGDLVCLGIRVDGSARGLEEALQLGAHAALSAGASCDQFWLARIPSFA